MPLEAVNKMIFSKLGVNAEDLLSVMEVSYDDELGPEVKENQEKILRIEGSGDEKHASGALADLLRDREKSDPDYARTFLFFVSGYQAVPMEGFKITVEFNILESGDVASLPVAHTCVSTLKLPGLAYEGDSNVLEEKLDKVIAYCGKVGFDMK